MAIFFFQGPTFGLDGLSRMKGKYKRRNIFVSSVAMHSPRWIDLIVVATVWVAYHRPCLIWEMLGDEGGYLVE